MQQNQHLFRRSVLAASLVTGLASCNGDPALLGELSGDPAATLASFDAEKPVLVARAHDDVIAVVFDQDPARIPPLLDDLLVPEIEGCGSGGWFGRDGWIGREGPVLCCDAAKRSFALNTESGWLYTGESCDPADVGQDVADKDASNGRPDDPYDDGIPYEQADEQLSRDLEQVFGIDYRFMLLSQRGGNARALVNGPLPDEELSQSKIQDPGLTGSSRVIPASHKNPPPAGGCTSNLGPSCSTGGDGKCRKSHKHIYYKYGDSNRWCEFPPTCSC